MMSHPCALVDDRFEKFTEELALAILTILGRDLAPHVGDENDVLQCSVTTEFPEHREITSGHFGKSFVGDTVHVDDSGGLGTSLVSGKKFCRRDWEIAKADVDSRGGQESCNPPKNIQITHSGVIESRGID